MKIKKKSIVILHYSLSNSEGKLLETTHNGPPAQFVCGTGLFMPGFEDELIGLKAGDKKTIIIGPEKGYGMVNENLVLKVHRSELPEVDIKVGGTLWRESSNGDKIPFKINGFLDDWVFLDGNHPWAGYELHYHVTILSVIDNGDLNIRVT
ncbi:FKBP-type peptidyl-prolyl cis-trans isomerase SlyD [Desulfosarcina sp. BuS5]|uniref:FKBP-type peptidyl-prolyl cis-trans isomerase n=1 Tax=Desulfosarcina sp. BuS5 TaxID=933262 RepID=UPI0004864C6B|nr:FKBP-type peptidyl-prolyl cis-trans isomerase [Desulfosarcina sp. BuS5]WDN88927.1 FKBP-type peptidyl-prolyl cis-trans isomerase SlyD [Desulfosarcina sp. BuS5]